MCEPIVDVRVVSEVCPLFFATGAPAALRRAFEAAGLNDVREHRHKEVLEFENERTLLSAMLLGGPVALAVKRFTPEAMTEVERAFLATVQQHCATDGRYFIPGGFVTAAGRR
jgi:hypothetical protein